MVEVLPEVDDGVVDVVEEVELEEVDEFELPKSLVVEELPVVPDAGVVDGVLLLPNELEPEDGVVEKELSVELDDPKPDEGCVWLDVEPPAL